MMASNAILAAIVARSRTGRGQRVEVALYDTAVTMTGYATLQNLFNDWQPRRVGNGSADTVPTGVFHASDGPFFMVCASTVIFQRVFRDVAGRPDIADDAELVRPAGRMAQRQRLIDMLATLFATGTRAHWLARLKEAGVPAGAVRTVAEALRSPETGARGLVTQLPHPTAGTVPNVAFPQRFHGTPAPQPVAAPTLGQHTRQVLETLLGYDARRLDEAARAGAFGRTAAHPGSAELRS